MEDLSQSSTTHENSVMTIPHQTSSRARNQTVVVERRRRRILLASKPGLQGSLSYSMVAVEDVEVVRTTTLHPNSDVEGGSRHDDYDTDLRKASDLCSKARATTGRARYTNSFQPRHHHYLPNGPARRSRYDVSPKQLKAPPASVIPPTTHVIHREGGDDNQNSFQHRQRSPPPSPYTSSCDTPYVRPIPDGGASHSSESSSHFSYSPRPRFESKAPGSLDIYPSPSYSVKPKETEDSHSRFERYPSESIEPLESPVLETHNPREGLGSREHELMELREFWKEFYSS